VPRIQEYDTGVESPGEDIRMKVRDYMPVPPVVVVVSPVLRTQLISRTQEEDVYDAYPLQ